MWKNQKQLNKNFQKLNLRAFKREGYHNISGASVKVSMVGVVIMCANNYLGLSSNKEVVEAAKSA